MYDFDHLERISRIGLPRAIEATREKRRKNIENYNKCPKLCKVCEKPIDYDSRINIFCSRSCAAKYNNIGKRRHGSPKYCVECGKETRAKHDVCKNCIVLHSFKYKTPTFKTIRKYLLQTREYRCERCKLTEWLGIPIPLESHHIDGNKYNNVDSNLELLCLNCHSFTDTFRVKNLKSKRRDRSEARIITPDF